MKSKQDDFVSASELARMGYCERQVAFDAACGEKVGPAQRQAQLRGQQAHQAFYQESQRIAKASATKGRCFVATLVLGASQETRSLRAFRDLYLRRSVGGRWLIGAYYRTSPCLCEWMKDKPKAIAGARQLLRMMAWLAAAAVERRVRVP